MDTFAQMLIAALLELAKRWKQCKCLPTDKWINKMLYIHTMEGYLAIKSEVLVDATT